jgi:biotin transport system substrate-specific component
MQQSYLVYEALEGRTWLKEAFVVGGASIIIALFALISIRLPFSPVPIAIQAHVILLLSCLLGSKRASLAVLTYLFQGAIGLPVFACGKFGLLHLAGPTGGYLLGYVAAAFVTGYLMERMRSRTPTKVLGAMALGNLIVFLFGVPRLSCFIGWQSAFLLGMLPFLVLDTLKLVLATKVLKSLRFFS